MSKLIIIGKDDIRELEFEEILEMYTPLIKNLIYKFWNLRMEAEDKYQIACIALWRAYASYDSKMKVGFGQLALKTITNDFLREINYNKRGKRSGVKLVSADRIIKNEHEEEAHSIIDTLESNISIEETVISKDNLDIFLKKITKKQKETIGLCMAGKKYNEIAKILGTGETAISMRMSAAKETFNKCMA